MPPRLTLLYAQLLNPIAGTTRQPMGYVLFCQSKAPAAVIACCLDPFSFLSHLSAMERHGLTDRRPGTDFMCGPSALKWRAMAKRRIEQDLGSSLDRYAAAGLPRLVRPDLSSIGRTHVRTCCRIGRLDPTAPHARETSIEWRLSLNVHSSPAANRKLPPGR